MKTLSIFLLCISVLLFGSFAGAGPEIKFSETKHNFGFVHQGDVLEYNFAFRNTGSAPLIIGEIAVECKCTEVSKPSSPVLPGDTASIHLKFNTRSAIDRQNRSIVVYSNAATSPSTLVFKCIVLKKKD